MVDGWIDGLMDRWKALFLKLNYLPRKHGMFWDVIGCYGSTQNLA
jgi:hypothetical protein